MILGLGLGPHQGPKDNIYTFLWGKSLLEYQFFFFLIFKIYTKIIVFFLF